MNPFRVIAGVLAVAVSAHALPSYRQQLPLAGTVPCPAGVTGCSPGTVELGEPASVCRGVGHASCVGGSLPLNPFGAAFMQQGFKWTAALCKADSDGDGMTNGQELGDPCCTWATGDEPSPYMSGFTATHPGFPSAVTAGYTAPACGGTDVAPSVKAPPRATFNAGEEQRVMEWKIKDYLLPRVRTTYVDMAFNFNDTTHDEFHIVWGEAIVHLTKHLHHFTIKGCPEMFPEEKTGVALAKSEIPQNCDRGMGGGWAPGRLMWDFPSNSGAAIGRKAGILAFVINVHFTDAEQVDADIFSRDGIRMHYTPDLRKYTTRTGNVILIGAADKTDMGVPAGEKRSFLTRTCRVAPTCTDLPIPGSLKKMMGGGRAAGLLALFTDCGVLKTNPIGPTFCKNKMVANLCTKTCSDVNGSPCTPGMKPLKMVAAAYHAHLLGREMYLSLSKKNGGATHDLGSANAWHYDDQATTPLTTKDVMLEEGDVLQGTCVFDSSARTNRTIFGKETVDEMCFVNLRTEHLTNASTEETGGEMAGSLGGGNFKCIGDMWAGALADGESALKIPTNHPSEKAALQYKNTNFIAPFPMYDFVGANTVVVGPGGTAAGATANPADPAAGTEGAGAGTTAPTTAGADQGAGTTVARAAGAAGGATTAGSDRKDSDSAAAGRALAPLAIIAVAVAVATAVGF